MPRQFLAHVLIDLDRNRYGTNWSADEDVRAHPDQAGPEAGNALNLDWDHPPYLRTLEVEPMLGVSGRSEEALTQIQHFLYDGAVQIGNSPVSADNLVIGGVVDAELRDYVRMLEAKVERGANVAEAKTPDEDWRPLTEDADGDVDGGNRSEAPPEPEAGAMSTSDGLGVDVPAGHSLHQLRADMVKPGDKVKMPDGSSFYTVLEISELAPDSTLTFRSAAGTCTISADQMLAVFVIDDTQPDGADVDRWTVFALYEDNLQPYTTTVHVPGGFDEAKIVSAAVTQCVADNDFDRQDDVSLIIAGIVAGEKANLI